MAPEVLETVMMDFIEGRYDVLCATAIIESGIDIPRANTMIIDRADLFGLSQLYQLRGRVGRAARARVLLPLRAAAVADERRGAGAHRGASRSSPSWARAFTSRPSTSSCAARATSSAPSRAGASRRWASTSTARCSKRPWPSCAGSPWCTGIDPELGFDEPSFLPEEYIEDVGVRLSLYKRLASARDDEEVQDLAAEMEDRFGPRARARAHPRAGDGAQVPRCARCARWASRRTRERVVVHLRDDSPIDAPRVLELCAAKRSPWKLTPDMRLSRRFDDGTDGVTNAERMLAELDAA
jgi:transcription-repair coupling factor (superfamily II helicase)